MSTRNLSPSKVSGSTETHQSQDLSFWTDDLELPAPHLLKCLAEKEQSEDWLNRLHARHFEILCSVLHLDKISSRQQKNALQKHAEKLNPYFLVLAFARSVHKHAVRRWK